MTSVRTSYESEAGHDRAAGEPGCRAVRELLVGIVDVRAGGGEDGDENAEAEAAPSWRATLTSPAAR